MYVMNKLKMYMKKFDVQNLTYDKIYTIRAFQTLIFKRHKH